MGVVKKIKKLPGFEKARTGPDLKNVTYESSEVVRDERGKVEKSKHVTSRKVKHDNFVMIYLEDLCHLQGLQGSQHEILHSLLARMDYTNLIVINKRIKEMIAEETSKTVSTISKALSRYVEKGLLIKDGRGTYLANPYLFGKGLFENVLKIRARLVYTAEGITLKSQVVKDGEVAEPFDKEDDYED